MNKSIRISDGDNVAVIVSSRGMEAGEELHSEGLVVAEHIPQGHKVALYDIPAGGKVIRYGVTIATARIAIPRGSWVRESLVDIPVVPSLDDLSYVKKDMSRGEPLAGYSFNGYRNPDGSVGTRNILGITTSVQCVAGIVNHVVKRLKDEVLPDYPNVDDIMALNHSYGCGVAINAPAAVIPIRTVKNLSTNPNLGGEVLIIGLGCEKLEVGELLEAHNKGYEKGCVNVSSMILQDEALIGFDAMVDAAMKLGRKHLVKLNKRKREECPVSDLVIGMQCGGSDAFSGLSANPVVGFAADMIVRAGGTAIFSEVTEVRDAVSVLASRCADEETFEALLSEMRWYDDYLEKGGSDRSANTTPGNKKGGLVNIVEKAMGSVIKSGSMPIDSVIGPGEKLKKKGLVFAATPASDFICGTLQLAAGMNLQIFTTGRGTPYGLAMAPVIKISSRKDLAERWFDLIDLDTGGVITGDASVENLGLELFHLILEIAGGSKSCAAEKLNLQNDLVLFNPAPIT